MKFLFSGLMSLQPVLFPVCFFPIAFFFSVCDVLFVEGTSLRLVSLACKMHSFLFICSNGCLSVSGLQMSGGLYPVLVAAEPGCGVTEVTHPSTPTVSSAILS